MSSGEGGAVKIDEEKPVYLETTSPSATLSTKHMLPDLGSNPGCLSGKPACIGLSPTLYPSAYISASVLVSIPTISFNHGIDSRPTERPPRPAK
jgi:hypothetical protein